MLLEAFYEQQKDKLTAVLTRYSRDAEAAKDAVQSSFLKALQQREIFSYMNEKACWSWLYTTAKNALTDEKRKNARYELRDGFNESEPDKTGCSAEETVIIKELLHKLPPHLAHIVSLKYWGGFNAAEIGKMKGIPPATVRTQLRTALSFLRNKL